MLHRILPLLLTLVLLYWASKPCYSQKEIRKTTVLVVCDSATIAVLPFAKIFIKDVTGNKTDSFITNSNGTLRTTLLLNHTYELITSSKEHDDYFDSFKTIEIKDTSEEWIKIPLRATCCVDYFFKPEWYFYPNSLDISFQTIPDSVISEMLRKYPKLVLLIEGFTDCKSKDEKANFQLSVARAEKIETLLKQLVPNGPKTVTRGWGSTKLSVHCNLKKCTSEEHQLNDCVTIKILAVSK